MGIDEKITCNRVPNYTDELEDALIVYAKALEKSIAINSKDHRSSIGFSMASLQIELGETEAARTSLQDAKISANKISDLELKQEINDLFESLTN